MPSLYRKRPIEIEAVQWTGENTEEIRRWSDGAVTPPIEVAGHLHVATLEGPLWASLGDWIIRGIKGEFYPCKPEIFDATYEAVDDRLH